MGTASEWTKEQKDKFVQRVADAFMEKVESSPKLQIAALLGSLSLKKREKIQAILDEENQERAAV